MPRAVGVTRLAGSAIAVSTEMLDIGERLDALYGGLTVTAAAAARSALASVTDETHRKRADKLMLRLDQLCANQRICRAPWKIAPPAPAGIAPSSAS
jgi:hypothetical protein